MYYISINFRPPKIPKPGGHLHFFKVQGLRIKKTLTPALPVWVFFVQWSAKLMFKLIQKTVLSIQTTWKLLTKTKFRCGCLVFYISSYSK